MEPGIWVGEAEVLYGRPCTYDAHAHGPTTLLSVPEPTFRTLLQEHPSFGEALLTLQAWSMRSLYCMMACAHETCFGAGAAIGAAAAEPPPMDAAR